MSEREMFEASFNRPANYFELNPGEQWHVDNRLGILDWQGNDLTKEDLVRFEAHYNRVS